MRKDAPCTKCEDRYIGCHADCPDYAAWKREKEIERGKRFDEKQKIQIIQSYHMQNVKKTKSNSYKGKKR